MLKILKWLFIVISSILLILVIVYFLGPKAKAPQFLSDLPELAVDINTIDELIKNKEANAGPIKKDNEARIIWHDSVPTKTAYAIVYLHGFGASQGEGAPVHQNIADSLQANLYLSRLEGHGLKRNNAFVGLTAEEYMQSAAEALAIGKVIGEKVILMTTSTGGAQALYLAANFPDRIAALVLYSPFIEMANENLQSLSIGPWHEKITETMLGDEITYTKRADSVAAYWSEYYHIDAYKALFSMVHHSTANNIVERVQVPTFMAYYFKDEVNQDDVVSVEAMKVMFERLPTKDKKAIAFPQTGDHVIASKWRSYDWQSVQASSLKFLEEHLDIKSQ